MINTLVPSRIDRVAPATQASETIGSAARSNAFGHAGPGAP